jgi:hypothetical protein
MGSQNMQYCRLNYTLWRLHWYNLFYLDVKYLNDLWAFNFKTNTWKEIPTTGEHPEPKSNCTMHYDSVTNQIIIFGGGGPNKARFNKISLLNW